ncbi:MAG: DUF4296 domain-containing protein [Bacteroidia bacterium]|nr:DUF4296 domain-containing protein [Bacteroidia bacterium]
MLFSCEREKTEQTPLNLIEREKFIEIMKDYALVESMLNSNTANASGPAFDSIYNFDVLKENGVTSSSYDSTLMYYTAHPDEYKELMDDVLEKLNVEMSKRN